MTTFSLHLREEIFFTMDGFYWMASNFIASKSLFTIFLSPGIFYNNHWTAFLYCIVISYALRDIVIDVNRLQSVWIVEVRSIPEIHRDWIVHNRRDRWKYEMLLS